MKELKGEVYYPMLKTTNDQGKYLFELSNLDAETVKFLKAEGVNLKNKGNELGNYTTIKGNYKPKITDSKGNELPDDMGIGYGTEVKIAYKTYKTEYNNVPYINVSLNTIMVLKLVPYDTGTLSVEEEGFTIDVGGADSSSSDTVESPI